MAEEMLLVSSDPQNVIRPLVPVRRGEEPLKPTRGLAIARWPNFLGNPQNQEGGGWYSSPPKVSSNPSGTVSMHSGPIRG